MPALVARPSLRRTATKKKTRTDWTYTLRLRQEIRVIRLQREIRRALRKARSPLSESKLRAIVRRRMDFTGREWAIALQTLRASNKITTQRRMLRRKNGYRSETVWATSGRRHPTMQGNPSVAKAPARQVRTPSYTRGPSGEFLVPIFFATTRTESQDQGLTFESTGEIAREKWGRAVVRFPKSHQIAHESLFAAMKRILRGERKTAIIEGIQSFSRAKIFTKVETALRKANSKDVLVYIHGANTSFTGCLYQAAQLVLDTNFAGAAIAYSWPSRGNARYYAHDLDLAPTVARIFAHWLETLRERYPDAAIHLVSHSMGCYIVALALGAAHLEPGPAEVVLASPDINAAVYAKLADAITAAAGRTTVYTSGHDRALGISAIARGAPRVGRSASAALHPNVDVIDAAGFGGDGTFWQHDVAFRDPITYDLAEVLRGVAQVRTRLHQRRGVDWYEVRK